MDIKQLLQLTVDSNASDLHLISGVPPATRIDGVLRPVQNEAVLTPQIIDQELKQVLTSDQLERLNTNKEIDFSLSFSNLSRFRVNVYTQKGTLAAAFRRIPLEVPTIDNLGLPRILHSF